MCMEKYLTVCGIGNGGGIIADIIYQQYVVNDENEWQNSGIDLMAIGNAWDLKELSVINKVKGKATQIAFSRITVFIACLGGDTMPALLPYYIEMARQQKSRVLVCFTLPFAVEGRERMQKAYHDFELLRNAADGYILVEFNALQLNSSGIVEAFREADNYVIDLEYARDMFLFSFYTRGMSFIDMAYLKKLDLKNGTITYRRRKTGQQLTIKWEKCMEDIIAKYGTNTATHYLLPIITNPYSDERTQYRNAICRINVVLKEVAKLAGLHIPLTMHVARHYWASVAKSKNIPLSVISEGMGHDSEETTHIYLASLDTSLVDKANNLILKDF